MLLHDFYFFSIRAEKNEGYPVAFGDLGAGLNLVFNGFFSLQLSRQGKFPGSAFVNSRAGEEPSVNVFILLCLLNMKASSCSC